MTEATHDQNVLARLMVMERQLISLERALADISEKLDECRMQSAKVASIPQIETKIQTIESTLHVLRVDIESGVWLRRLGYGIVTATMLTLLSALFTGLHWGSREASADNDQLAELIKRLNNEYSKK